MLQSRIVFIFCALCFIGSNSEVSVNHDENSFETYQKEIDAVLNFLKSTPVTVYKYKQGVLLNAHKKADIIELTLDVQVECINNYPDIPCTEKVLTCTGFVRNTNVEGSKVLGNVECIPKTESVDDVDNNYQVESEIIQEDPIVGVKQSIVLSNEAVSSEVGDHFVAIRRDSVPCLGCPFELNTNADGVDELVYLALRHVESERTKKYALVKVLKIQQQVVSGVKYVLLVEIAPTVCLIDSSKPNQAYCPLDGTVEPAICEITFLQRPWITKAKHIINNNCTISQEFSSSTPNTKHNSMSNEININDGGPIKQFPNDKLKPNNNFDYIAETGVIDDISSSRLADLESQILIDEAEPSSSVVQSTTKKFFKPQDDFVVIEEFIVPSTAQSDAYGGVYVSNPTIPIITQPLEDRPSNVFTEEAPSDASLSPTVMFNDDTTKTEPSATTSEASVEFVVSTIDDKSTTPQSIIDGNVDEQKGNSSENLMKSESNESSNDPSQFPSINTNDSHNSSEESVESVDELNKSEESSNSEKSPRQKRAIRQLEKISPDEKNLVKLLADYVAVALDSIDDDNRKRIVLQILGAKKMVADGGVYYHLILRMGISQCWEDKASDENCREKLLENYTKICKVQVHVNDEFGNPKIVKSQCQNIKRDNNESNRTNYSRFKRDHLVGGLQDYDKNSTKIVQFLSETLTHLDSQSVHENKYKPVEVISANSQVVAGILYRIKAKIGVSNCLKTDSKDLSSCELLEGSQPKICEIKVWEKLWLNYRQFTVKCEGDDDKEHVFETKASDKSRRSVENLKRFRRSAKPENTFNIVKEYRRLFKAFVKKYNRSYVADDKEYRNRYNIFIDNMKYINMLNANEQGSAIYGVTQFADFSREEFSQFLGLRSNLRNENEVPFPSAQIPNIELPNEFDWRKNGVVSEVKNQQQCGSCWAFSVTGNIEGQYAIKHGHLLEFSEQELVDCDDVDQGCNGGLMDNAYRVIEKLGGLETEQDYPYDAKDEKCHFNKTMARVEVTGALNISHNETDMAKWLVKNGPISIAINANAMQFYFGGVSHPLKFLCNPNSLDHGVLIVGYGVHNYPLFKKSLPYWIVKNSWGSSWGEQGYYRVYRGDGTCGLNQTPSSAIIA